MSKSRVNAIAELQAGKTIPINNYLTAVYLPKSDRVFIDCEVGCCSHELSLVEFQQHWCNPDWTLKNDYRR